MALALELNSLSKEVRKTITNTLTFKSKKTTYNPEPQNFTAFAANRKDNAVYVPLYQYLNYLDKFPYTKHDFPRTNLKFRGKLHTKETDNKKRDQDVVFKKATKLIDENHAAFISCYTGFGKTATAICILTHYRLKTAVVCHSNQLKPQWEEEIKNFCGEDTVVQIVQGKKPLDPEADVYIFGIQKAANMEREELMDIGLVIIDEAHICTITAFTKSLLKFQPLYILGLSATPERNDGMHQLLYAYFGPQKDFIVREETKDFTVVKYCTHYKPEVSYTVVHGRTTLNWTEMMNSLSYNENRQKEIVNIILSEPKRKVIVLCGRKDTATAIHEMLKKGGESTELLVGTKKKWDKSKRVLVAGMKKGGTGLNDPELDMLVLEHDCKNVIQFEGRLRTSHCIIYDIVDDYPTLETHWSGRNKDGKLIGKTCPGRERWYLKKGATIVQGGPRGNKNIVKKEGERKRFLKRND